MVDDGLDNVATAAVSDEGEELRRHNQLVVSVGLDERSMHVSASGRDEVLHCEDQGARRVYDASWARPDGAQLVAGGGAVLGDQDVGADLEVHRHLATLWWAGAGMDGIHTVVEGMQLRCHRLGVGTDVGDGRGDVDQVASVGQEDDCEGIGGREAGVDSDRAQATEGRRRAVIDGRHNQGQPGRPVVLREARTDTEGLEPQEDDVLKTLHTAVAPAGIGGGEVMVTAEETTQCSHDTVLEVGSRVGAPVLDDAEEAEPPEQSLNHRRSVARRAWHQVAELGVGVGDGEDVAVVVGTGGRDGTDVQKVEGEHLVGTRGVGGAEQRARHHLAGADADAVQAVGHEQRDVIHHRGPPEVVTEAVQGREGATMARRALMGHDAQTQTQVTGVADVQSTRWGRPGAVWLDGDT